MPQSRNGYITRKYEGCSVSRLRKALFLKLGERLAYENITGNSIVPIDMRFLD
jgi:hypothetical protein